MKRLPLILLFAAVALFMAGLVHLLHLRFEAGDVYPPYSSFRADPLGTKALYESLGRLLTVQRNYQSLPKLENAGTTALFVLGLDPRELRAGPEELKFLEGFVGEGGRLVIALAPQFREPRTLWWERERPSKGTNSPADKSESKPGKSRPKRPLDRDEEFGGAQSVSLGERWGFRLQYAETLLDEDGVFRPALAERAGEWPLPESLEWHSAAWCQVSNEAWRVIYARERGRAVALEREFGNGAILLLTDSYHFSNEALRQDRQSEWLAWLVGPTQRVIFDEAHLGVQENPGIAALARRYRLHGVALALLVLAVLFIWKNALPFMPAPGEESSRDYPGHILGKESAAGFVNVLRRNIRAADLLRVCFEEWKKSCAHTVSAAKLRELQAVIEEENGRKSGERDVVGAYRECCEVTERMKRKT